MSESDYISGMIQLYAPNGSASISIRGKTIATSSDVWDVWFASISNSLVYYTENTMYLFTNLNMDYNELSLYARYASISYKIIHFM